MATVAPDDVRSREDAPHGQEAGLADRDDTRERIDTQGAQVGQRRAGGVAEVVGTQPVLPGTLDGRLAFPPELSQVHVQDAPQDRDGDTVRGGHGQADIHAARFPRRSQGHGPGPAASGR